MAPHGEIATIKDLVATTRTLLDDFHVEPWFRGHSNQAYMLQPGVYRDPRWETDEMFEQTLTNEFCDRARSRRVGCPRDDEYAAWLFLMQHYGLPTRILDWSTSPLTALWFAVTGNDATQDGALWALDPNGLNVRQVKRDFELAWWDYKAENLFRPAWGMSGATQIAAISGLEFDARMAAQSCMFTVHGKVAPLEKLPGKKEFLRKYIIPKKSIRKLAKDLRILGIRRSLLFPDLENLARELRTPDPK